MADKLKTDSEARELAFRMFMARQTPGKKAEAIAVESWEAATAFVATVNRLAAGESAANVLKSLDAPTPLGSR